jgi:peptide/nickel transport system permease protein
MIFSLSHLLPGDAVAAMMAGEGDISEETMQAMRENLGLNDPFFIQYFHWLGNLCKGDMGVSLISFTPVRVIIMQKIGPTFLLMGISLLISIVIGVILGIVSAIKQYSVLDYVLSVFAFLGKSVPVFFVGMLFIYFLALKNAIFPTNGIRTIGISNSLKDLLMHLFLPALSLSILRISEFLRYTRASVLEVVNNDYIWTAKSKGLGYVRIMTKHILRNALIPIITLIGLNIPVLFNGAMIIEQVFQWPGLGMMFYNSIITRDYPLLMGMVFISSAIVLLSNLITDILYAVADPRIRYE